MYHLIDTLVWMLSKIPMKGLYWLSDLLYILAFHLIKYRRKVVESNLRSAFPDKTTAELKRIEREFYHFFADYVVETIKLRSMSEAEIRKRMEFTGVEDMMNKVSQQNKKFAFIYLAHYGNWEWVASLALHIHDFNPLATAAQIYHPLRSKAFDRLFLNMRSQFGGVNIAMKETLRYVIHARHKEHPTIIGFIADQGPKWNSIHHWTDFLHHNTPVFIGTEQLGKRVDALIYYGHMERISRGHYCCHISLLTDNIKKYPDYEVTDQYFALLEKSIQAHPAIWLWTHKRWKRTYEEYLKRKSLNTKS